jgi:Xaa-Pro aminopeptidase
MNPPRPVVARLRQRLAEQSVDALLVSQPENRRYLSGFTGSAGVLLITSERALIATDFRYCEQVGIESPLFELVKTVSTFVEVLPEMLARQPLTRVGFEADHATFSDVQEWMAAVPVVEWVQVRGLVLELRAVKDADEIDALREAIGLTDAALAAALTKASLLTERDLAWLIDSTKRSLGAPSVSFDIIVASGPNGSRPHATASDAALPAGQPIVIDMGAKVDGYCGDLTRTICLGSPTDPDRFWDVYNAVLRAQQAAEAAIRPGLTGQEIDAVARDLISEAGFGGYFGHGLGHGVGLAVHVLQSFLPGPLWLAMVCKTGIYLPGWGGVRIEDVVLVTEDGVEVLTKHPGDRGLSGLKWKGRWA